MSTLLVEPSTTDGPPAPASTEPRGDPAGREPARPREVPRLLSLAGPTLLVAAVLCLITFIAGAGLNLGPTTTVEIGLTIGCGLAIAATVLLSAPGRATYGLWPAALLLAFAALAALSVVWSVQPDASWQAASRLLAYSAVFGLAALLARAAPRRWSAVLGGVLLASAIVCGYALLTKIFPNRLGVAQVVYYARLREPYGYWNATGLAAALGAIACLWLGARRSGHALLNALAYPAMAIMLVTLMLAYSRGALAALLIGVVLWLCLVPLRLRGATVLIVGGLGAGIVVAWDFSREALTTDTATLATRIDAGHQLGVLLAAVLLALTLAGLAIGFLTSRDAPSQAARRQAGILLLSLPAIAVLAVIGMLAVSHRGLTGSISHGLGSLTNPSAAVPANGPARLTAVSSARARYWHEALQVFKAHPLLGAGAEGYATARLRYRTLPLDVQQAHGFVVQTLADLGLIGLLLVLALLGTWMVAAGRATHPFNRSWRHWRWRRWPIPDRVAAHGLYTPERIGLLTMLCLVVTFGVHSFVDWTWYVPGLACAALLCAGWLAGRGPLAERLATVGVPAGVATSEAWDGERARTASGQEPAARSAIEPTQRRGPLARDRQTLGIAVAVVVAALLAAWAEWQPQHSQDASDQALALIAHDPAAALAAAHTAVSRDPLSAEALITLATVEQGTGQNAAAAATYERAVHLQPSNWQTWEALGEYELRSGDPRGALQALRAAVYLNPQAVAPRAIIGQDEQLVTLQNDYLQALRETAAKGGTAAATGASASTGAAGTTGTAASGHAAASLKSARGAHSRAARAALPALHRTSASRLLGSQNRRAA
jgi:cytochrome c-type biogenesis protein CcmH/NrfG